MERGPAERARRARRPHVLGIDDGPLDVRRGGDATLVGVVTEAADLVEAVAVTRFPVDGPDVTRFLGDWVRRQRFGPQLHAIVLGGITIAGLGIVDLPALARRTRLPVLAVTRRDPSRHRLPRALDAAGLAERLAVVERTPPAWPTRAGVWVAAAGASRAEALALVRACTGKAKVPEPLRLAHLVARAIVSGASRGRA